MPKFDVMHAPADVKQRRHDVRSFGDTSCVNGLPFLRTISEVLTLRTIARLRTREKDSLSGFLTAVIDLNKKYGFNVTIIDTDLEL